MYQLKQQLLPNASRIRPGGNFDKLSFTVHSTGNPSSTAQNERDWLDNPSNNRDASWHYVVGEGIVIQAIPDQEEAWHCGSQTGNQYSIGIELVESGSRRAVLETAAEFIADKLKEYGYTKRAVVKHQDWTGKNCPRILIDPAYIKNGMGWEYLCGQIEEYIRRDGMEKRYQTIGELPDWAKPTIKLLAERGKIADKNHLDLTMDMLRTIVILSR